MSSSKRRYILPFLCLAWTGLLWGGSPPAGIAKPPPLRQLVRTSDYIVVGTLNPAAIDSSQDRSVVWGSVAVEQVLWGEMISFLTGEVMGAEDIQVQWRPPHGQSLDGSGLHGIWLLAEVSPNLHRAGEWSYVGLESLRKINSYLRHDMVTIRQSANPQGPVMEVDLIFRNATKRDALVPEFRYENGTLYLHPRVRLTVKTIPPSLWKKARVIPPRIGRLRHLDREDELVVQVGEEYLVRLNLDDLFELEGQTAYQVQLHIKGYGKSTVVFPSQIR